VSLSWLPGIHGERKRNLLITESTGIVITGLRQACLSPVNTVDTLFLVDSRTRGKLWRFQIVAEIGIPPVSLAA
jgi:hypothetical protein